MSLGRLQAVFGINIYKIVQVLSRAQAMYDGLAADPATYANPPVALAVFLTLIVNLAKAQQAVKTRAVGARETRDVHHGLLLTAMGAQRSFVQGLADADPTRAAALITGAGLLVGLVAARTKALLTLRNAKQSGSVACEANVGLLVGTDAKHPTENRYFNWSYTIDGGKSFVTMTSTTRGKTTIHGLTPLTTVGVRVSLTNSEGPGEWSDVVTILVL